MMTYLLPLDLLGVEVVCLRHVQMRSDILIVHGLEHAPFDWDLMEVLIMVLVLEVVHNRDLWRIVLDHQLGRH